MTKRYYLAYGSNLNVFQMKMRCPSARALGTAEIADYRLLFKGSKTGSYLTIEPQKDGTVPVAVWEVTPQDEERLDRYEGYPTFYYKKDMKISFTGLRTGKKRTRSCFVYIMHEERPLGTPTAHYLQVCYEGYDHFGFDPKYLVDAYIASSKEDEE